MLIGGSHFLPGTVGTGRTNGWDCAQPVLACSPPVLARYDLVISCLVIKPAVPVLGHADRLWLLSTLSMLALNIGVRVKKKFWFIETQKLSVFKFCFWVKLSFNNHINDAHTRSVLQFNIMENGISRHIWSTFVLCYNQKIHSSPCQRKTLWHLIFDLTPEFLWVNWREFNWAGMNCTTQWESS